MDINNDFPIQAPRRALISEARDVVSDINNNSDSVVHSFRDKLLHKYLGNIQASLNMTRSGRVFKNSKYPEPLIQPLQSTFGNQSKKQQKKTWELLRSGKIHIDGDYA